MFNLFGSNATIADVIRERKNDIAAVNFLKEFKRSGRDRTGIRAEPSADDDVQSGDKEGDEVLTSSHIYQFRRLNNALQWVRINATTSF
jgi:hypothetical protein